MAQTLQGPDLRCPPLDGLSFEVCHSPMLGPHFDRSDCRSETPATGSRHGRIDKLLFYSPFFFSFRCFLLSLQIGANNGTGNYSSDGLNIERCVEQINKASRGEFAPEELKERHAMQDPEIQNILLDPVMRQVLIDFQENPKAAQEHTKNPIVMNKIQKLVTAGIVQMR